FEGLAAKLTCQFPGAVRRGPDALSVRWPGVATTVELRYVRRLGGRDRLFLGAPIWPASSTPALQALELNNQLLYGALAVVEGYLPLRHVLSAGQFQAADLEECISTLRVAAQRIRARLARASCAEAPAFNAYAD